MLNINKIILLLISLYVFVSVTNLNAGTIAPELQSMLSSQRGFEKVDLIIEFTDKINIANTRTLKRKEKIRSLKNKNLKSKNKIKSFLGLNQLKQKDLWLKNSVAVSVPASLIPVISSFDDVSVVRLDRKIVLESTGQGSNPIQLNWNITSIGADLAWNKGVTGEGVVIGSMDTGVDINHPDLSASWRGGSNSWFDPYEIHETPYDSNGHGTQTTSLIVGGNASGYGIGVAPGAKWVAAKIFDDSNTASLSAIHLAFQWMLDPDGNPDTDDGADIVNNSWNFGVVAGQCDYEFQDDISILRSADVAVVFSAGNSGPSPETSHSPANNEDTIPVGAVNESLNVTFYSSRGPSACDDGDIYPKLAAPGENLLTADLTFGGIIPNSYAYSSGTSYAAPHVTGALALLQSKFPSSSLSNRENALYETAAITGPTTDYGKGIIDVDAALKYMGSALLYTPTGEQGENNIPIYSWSAVPDTYEYRLRVRKLNGDITDNWITPSEAGCTENESTCSIPSSSSLANGKYHWRIQAKNSMGKGFWSSAMKFTVGFPPIAATLVSPFGSLPESPTPAYQWNAVPEASSYFVWIKSLSTSNVFEKNWYTADQVGCGNGETICSFPSSSVLDDGKYRWRIKAKSNIGNSPWSAAMDFSIGLPPVAVSLLSPMGHISEGSNLTFAWSTIPNATSYLLWIKNRSTNDVIERMWYTSEQAHCNNNESICSITLGTTLDDGNYRWRIRAKNALGNGPPSSTSFKIH